MWPDLLRLVMLPDWVRLVMWPDLVRLVMWPDWVRLVMWYCSHTRMVLRFYVYIFCRACH